MSQDLRNLLKKEREQSYSMKKGHEERFMKLLDESFPRERNRSFRTWTIAASIVLLLGLGIYFIAIDSAESPVPASIVNNSDEKEAEEGISLGDLSPDLRNIENYYVANINLELSQLEISPENKVLVDSFMERLAELNMEYKELNKELNSVGPNDQTIGALIQNLQLRLELLYKLKDKLNELKSSENEQVTANSI